MIYEKIENIHDDKNEILLADLKERTGIKIKRYEIQKIDFPVATLTMFPMFNGRFLQNPIGRLFCTKFFFKTIRMASICPFLGSPGPNF